VALARQGQQQLHASTAPARGDSGTQRGQHSAEAPASSRPEVEAARARGASRSSAGVAGLLRCWDLRWPAVGGTWARLGCWDLWWSAAGGTWARLGEWDLRWLVGGACERRACGQDCKKQESGWRQAAAGTWEGNQGLGLGLVISYRWCTAVDRSGLGPAPSRPAVFMFGSPVGEVRNPNPNPKRCGSGSGHTRG
jgi:hypothetical protein